MHLLYLVDCMLTSFFIFCCQKMSTSLEFVSFLAGDVAEVFLTNRAFMAYFSGRVVHICSIYHMNAVGRVFVLILKNANYSCMHINMTVF
jgi:hypothetical protein